VEDIGTLTGLLAFAVIVGAMIWFVTAYNNLLAAAHRTSQAWGNVDALLRQRHDELPRFLDACQPHVPNEQALFDRVLEARSTIFGARQTQDIPALSLAELELNHALGEIVARASKQPGVDGDQTFTALRRRIAALDQGIAERRAIFNDAAAQNNLAVGRFPGNIVALLGGFRAVPPFTVNAGQS
jgi:LemA protein